jgi:hypothetical protein
MKAARRMVQLSREFGGLMLRSVFKWIVLILVISACSSRPTAEPKSTVTPGPTSTPRPTPTATPIPNCPVPNNNATWIAPDIFDHYPEAIRKYLNNGGPYATLAGILRDASSITKTLGSVTSFDLTGDSDPETIVSIYYPASQVQPPSGLLLIYGCAKQQINLLYTDKAVDPESMTQIMKVDNLIGAPRSGQIATLKSICGAHTCFTALNILGWNGSTLVSLMAEPLNLPAASYVLSKKESEAVYHIEAQAGLIGSVGAGPQRTETQMLKWNGAQFAKVSATLSPIVYRIHAIYEADDAFAKGDYQTAIDWYGRAITDDSLKDWLTEIGYSKAHDRGTLTAYARFRLLVIGVLRGEANAHDQLDQLTNNFPPDNPDNNIQQMASIFWNKYQATKDIKAACAAADAFANDKYQIIDNLGLFGYANRSYTSDDMCPSQ